MKPSYIHISGKKISLPENPETKWSFHPRPGGWIIAESDQGNRVRLMIKDLGKLFSISVNGHLWRGEWGEVDEGGPGVSDSLSNSDLVAQFPGKVRKILVHPGQKVKEGEDLILVEAMKMEFAIKAPFSGKVKKVFVGEGQQLMPGDPYLDLRGEEE